MKRTYGCFPPNKLTKWTFENASDLPTDGDVNASKNYEKSNIFISLNYCDYFQNCVKYIFIIRCFLRKS